MKKSIKYIILVSVLTVVGIISYLFLLNSNGLAEGKYYIKNNMEFPDAYVLVNDNTIQFFNIDFNSMFREQQLSSILIAQEERGVLNTGLSRQELENLSDINHLVVDQAYDFSALNPMKQGTNEYSYFLACEGNLFGLWINYNTWDKIIKIPGKTPTDQEIVFEK